MTEHVMLDRRQIRQSAQDDAGVVIDNIMLMYWTPEIAKQCLDCLDLLERTAVDHYLITRERGCGLTKVTKPQAQRLGFSSVADFNETVERGLAKARASSTRLDYILSVTCPLLKQQVSTDRLIARSNRRAQRSAGTVDAG
jgi:hypothetical protein